MPEDTDKDWMEDSYHHSDKEDHTQLQFKTEEYRESLYTI